MDHLSSGRCRLRIPDGGRLRWRVKVGEREFDVRDDHYDSRQWFGAQNAGVLIRERGR